MTWRMVVLIGCLVNGVAVAAPLPLLESPDGQNQLRFELDEEGRLCYQVSRGVELLLRRSCLGLAIKDQPALARFDLLSHQLATHDHAWQLPWGERRQMRDHHNELWMALGERGGERRLHLRARAFDDGVAFRYEFPEQAALKSFVITRELTEFDLAGDFDSWWIEANYDSYERLFQQTPASRVAHANTPLTFRTARGTHLSLHEAALTDFPSMTLKRGEGTRFDAVLVPWANGDLVRTAAPRVSPWRSIQIAGDAAGLLESTMILNLNEPNRLADTSWIKPMTYIGIWWGIHIGVHTWTVGPRHGATTERAREYIDFAAANNIGGVLIEGWNKGWDQWGTRDAYIVPAEDFDLEAVAAYARQKGVRLIGHNETGGNVEAYEAHVEEIFSLYSTLGINTVKTGYVAEHGLANGEHHQGQWGVNHYRRIVQLAAKHRIMINAHEPIKDTGIRRTYPNMMTREGARGGEWNAWSEGNPPEHTLILPFTRLLGGPMDYTPGIFDIDYSNFSGERFSWNGESLKNKPFRVHSTLARQLAEMVLLYSPLQMAADMIENYRAHPAFEFVRALNVDFDDTRVLSAAVGEHLVLARRSGKQWYLAAATNREPRTLAIALDFLPVGEKYRASIYRDAEDAHWQSNPEAYHIEVQDVDAGTSLKMHLAPGGGFAAVLEVRN